MGDDYYVYPRVDPERRRRFLKYLAVEWKIKNKTKSTTYRKDFMERLDALRGIEHVSELHKAVKKDREQEEKPGQNKQNQDAEKISKLLKDEDDAISQIDLKEEMTRVDIGELRDRIKEMGDAVNTLVQEKYLEKLRELEIEKKLNAIKQKQSAKSEKKNPSKKAKKKTKSKKRK
jgi:hypothetical protein